MNNSELFDRPYREIRTATFMDFYHVHNYLKDPMWNRQLLSDRTNDATVHAIVSYLLEFDDESLTRFEEIFSDAKPLATILKNERNIDDRAYVFTHPYQIPYIMTSFKVLAKYFRAIDNASNPTIESKPFQLMPLISRGFVEELCTIYEAIRGNNITKELIDIMERPLPPQLADDPSNVGCKWIDLKSGSSNPMCFVTGQAACGKTTLLETLKNLGYRSISRGRMGGQDGKCYDSFPIAALHATIEFVLMRYDSVIGVSAFFP